jgi:hypothetical protein
VKFLGILWEFFGNSTGTLQEFFGNSLGILWRILFGILLWIISVPFWGLGENYFRDSFGNSYQDSLGVFSGFFSKILSEFFWNSLRKIVNTIYTLLN